MNTTPGASHATLEILPKKNPNAMDIIKNVRNLKFDITCTDDGEIRKCILEEGSGKLPTKLSKLRVKYYGKILYKGDEGMEEEFIFDNAIYQEHSITLFSKSVKHIEGFHVSLASMKKGELSAFAIGPKYAYGSLPITCSTPFPELKNTIPANSTLLYVIKVNDMEWRRPEPNDWKENLQYAKEDREEGNSYYLKKESKKALQSYRRAKFLLDNIKDKDLRLEDETMIREEKCKIHLNIAKTLMFMSDFGSLIENTRMIIKKLDSDNQFKKRMEAHYLQAKSHRLKQCTNNAMEEIQEALNFEPNNEKFLAEKKKIEHLMKITDKKYVESMKKLWNGDHQVSSLYENEKPFNQVEESQKLAKEPQEKQLWFTSDGDEFTSFLHPETRETVLLRNDEETDDHDKCD